MGVFCVENRGVLSFGSWALIFGNFILVILEPKLNFSGLVTLRYFQSSNRITFWDISWGR